MTKEEMTQKAFDLLNEAAELFRQAGNQSGTEEVYCCIEAIAYRAECDDSDAKFDTEW